ncbi:MAG: PEP-CTERM sorting domain-containing protein [Pseudomonadales bacterium]
MNIPRHFSKALKLLAAAPLLAGSMAASAALIEVNYEGTISYTSGDGAGYSVGDFLSGTFVIDTDLLPADRNNHADVADYYQINNTHGDFVSGSVDNDDGLYDRLYMADHSNGFEQFYVMDRDYSFDYVNSANRSYSDRFVNVSTYGYNLDFLNGVSADQVFDLATGDVQYMNGTIYNYEYAVVNGNYLSISNGNAQFALTGLSVGPASVPAPTSIALLGLGLLGLAAARRRKGRASR